MIRHDQLFKDLLRAFFGDFLRLVAPEAAARLRLARVRFLDTETFTDLATGRLADRVLVARSLEEMGLSYSSRTST